MGKRTGKLVVEINKMVDNRSKMNEIGKVGFFWWGGGGLGSS